MLFRSVMSITTFRLAREQEEAALNAATEAPSEVEESTDPEPVACPAPIPAAEPKKAPATPGSRIVRSLIEFKGGRKEINQDIDHLYKPRRGAYLYQQIV